MVSEATYLSPFDTKPFTIKNTTVAACSREKIRGTTIGSEFAFGKANNFELSRHIKYVYAESR